MKIKLLAVVLAAGLIMGNSAYVFAAESMETNEGYTTLVGFERQNEIKKYCDYYGITFSESDEFIREVSDMLNERKVTANGKINADPRILKKKRKIPTSYIGDIIWTNNPITPWNHVGLYTAEDKITESLLKGVKQRDIGVQMEYPFKIYKVVQTNTKERYSTKNRKAVSAWGLKQLGKEYDFDFADNKKNTVEENNLFNCSEFVWKAWRFNGKVTVDLDCNGGKGVYPNNIKNSDRTVKIKEG